MPNNLLYCILRLEDTYLEPFGIIYKKKDHQSFYYKLFSQQCIHILRVTYANVSATPEKFHESWQYCCKLWKKRYLSWGRGCQFCQVFSMRHIRRYWRNNSQMLVICVDNGIFGATTSIITAFSITLLSIMKYEKTTCRK